VIVNVASRMESTGECNYNFLSLISLSFDNDLSAMKIHITEATKELLTDIGGFAISERGPVAVKVWNCICIVI
jgi:hypothetical protein